MRILVVDDNKTNRAAAEQLLADHDTTIVGTYAEAQELIRKEEFEAVLVDLNLPPGRMGVLSFDVPRETAQPVGAFLALLALERQVAYIGLLTDANHHENYASACLDPWRSGRVPMTFGQSRIALVNSRCINTYKYQGGDDQWVYDPGPASPHCEPRWPRRELQLPADTPSESWGVSVKQWDELLAWVMEEHPSQTR